jgi:uncharacterized protein (DUF1330 family)
MAAYVIVDIEVTDPAGFEAYRRDVPASIAAFGGRYLTRGGTVRTLECDWTPKRCVVLEFPSLEAFDAWWDSPAYQPLRALRQRTSRSNIIVTEGV